VSLRRAISTFALVAAHLLSNTAQSRADQSQSAYIRCESYSPEGVPVFESPCAASFATDKSSPERISCGEMVSVIGRAGSWLKVIRSDGRPGYVFSTEVSHNKKRWVEVSVPGPREFDVGTCFTPKIRSGQPGKLTPNAIYAPDPEIGPLGIPRGFQGSVSLSLMVGTDGLAHDVKVEKSLDRRLDQKAIETVQRWKFDPAVEDGKPVPFPIHVAVTFRVY
jgi:TonB family protein